MLREDGNFFLFFFVVVAAMSNAALMTLWLGIPNLCGVLVARHYSQERRSCGKTSPTEPEGMW